MNLRAFSVVGNILNLRSLTQCLFIAQGVAHVAPVRGARHRARHARRLREPQAGARAAQAPVRRGSCLLDLMVVCSLPLPLPCLLSMRWLLALVFACGGSRVESQVAHHLLAFVLAMIVNRRFCVAGGTALCSRRSRSGARYCSCLSCLLWPCLQFGCSCPRRCPLLPPCFAQYARERKQRKEHVVLRTLDRLAVSSLWRCVLL